MRGLPEAFDESTQQTAPERRLMMAVILAAITDAIGRSAVNEPAVTRAAEQSLARRWFQESGDDFQATCIGAGFDPETVRTGALAFIDAHAQSTNRRRSFSFGNLAEFHEQRRAA